MRVLAAFTHHNGIRLAELAFVLITFAGIWFAVADLRQVGLGRARGIVGGGALAAAGVLLFAATRWGHFR